MTERTTGGAGPRRRPPGSTPEEQILSGESRRVLESAIDGLPGHYRAVLVLRDGETC